MKRLFYIAVLCLVATGLSAQDIHFSQFFNAPLSTNPAMAGLFDADYRFAGIYRNQWFTVPVSYSTLNASADTRFEPFGVNNGIGAGVLLGYDRAGDSKFTTLHLGLSGSYIKGFGQGIRHYISIGVQPSLVNRSFNLDELNFDIQYNGDVFDPTIPINEGFNRTGFTYFDLVAGVAYRVKTANRTEATVDFSAAHLTQPNQTFYTDNTSKLNIRYAIGIQSLFQVKDNIDFGPQLFFQTQDTKNELLVGMLYRWHLPTEGKKVALNFGGFYRLGDAAVGLVGIDYNQLSFNVSYDINVSSFAEATNTVGGVETSLIYLITKVDVVDGAVCPVF